MLEVAVVLDGQDRVIHWHEPPLRTSVVIPDTRALWDVLWRNRTDLAGVAHTHPGSGHPAPSQEDLTTFAACEAGLGVRLMWWIATTDHLAAYRWRGPGRLDYAACPPTETSPPWLAELRRRSYDLRGGYSHGSDRDRTT